MSATEDAEYLLSHGWRSITSKRGKYGIIHYWDHSDHQRTDGLWYTQGEALRLQRQLINRDYSVDDERRRLP